jgi:monoamine oxidase
MSEQKKCNANQKGRLSRRQVLGAATGTALAAIAPGAVATGTGTVGSDDPSILDVIVIGGGLAGLTAARDLARAGNESFVVLEARDRVGGRTLNHQLQGSYFSEAGGQWIGPGQTAIYDLCRELDIGTFPTYLKGRAVYLSGEQGRFTQEAGSDVSGGSPALEAIVAELNEMALQVPSGAAWTAPRAAELDAITVGDWLSTKSLDSIDSLGFGQGIRLSNGTHMQNVSMLYFLSMINFAGSYHQLEGFEGGAQETRIEGGSQWISTVMAQALGDKLRLSTPVRKITGWDTDTATVHTDAGALRARQVIVALSPALCNQVQYQPQLPAARQELQRRWPAYAPARKVAHVYSRPFWRDLGFNGWIFDIGGAVWWGYDNSPQDGSIGVINAFVDSSLPADPAVVGPLLASVYARAFGDNEALEFLEYHDQDWGVEPWSLSCVSPLTPGMLTSGLMPALRAPVGKLHWSGTETAEIWHGYMDGAVRSGHQAALQALNALRTA